MLGNPNPLRCDIELHYLQGSELPRLGQRIRIGREVGTVHQYVERAYEPTIVRVRLDEQPRPAQLPADPRAD